jgi:2'-5' RNA ligase
MIDGMHRLFVALRPPPPIRAALSAAMGGVPGARWQNDEQLHLTLRFIGEVDGRVADDVALALGQVHAPPVEIALAGVGAFDKNGRVDALWVGVTPHDALAALHRKVDHAMVRVGLAPEGRTYLPHITLARLPRSMGAGIEIERWRADHAAMSSAPFTLDYLYLFASTLGSGGARYEAIDRWPLA